MWFQLKLRCLKRLKSNKYLFRKMNTFGEIRKTDDGSGSRTFLTEGKATISTGGKVFFNPVQEFNRDLSIATLNAFARIYAKEKSISNRLKEPKPIDLQTDEHPFVKGEKYANGLTILEALSATGLRSIRYAKEVAGICSIVANDFNPLAVEDIKKNIESNNVAELVTAGMNDAVSLMYEHKAKSKRFDVIDLDPYGSPTIFFDSAIEAISDGGLLLVTATDMAVLAGNAPETCYSKYGSISLRLRSCHEMALRILIQSIESHANRHGRYIVPQLAVSADFYIRVFVRVYTSPHICKFTLSKLSLVYRCKGCDSFELQPLGKTTKLENGNTKFSLQRPQVSSSSCEHCKRPYELGGPIWSAPIQNPEFVKQILLHASSELNTYQRIRGMLTVVLEELNDVPLYYCLNKITSVLHVEEPKMIVIRSALLNAGYQVSFAHSSKTSIKTNAPGKVIWDIMRTWAKSYPISQKWLKKDNVTSSIMSQDVSQEYSFNIHSDANPESRRLGYKRFQENPAPFWGPGCRSTLMANDDTAITKSQRNQGKKRKYGKSNNSDTEIKMEDEQNSEKKEAV